MDCFHHPAVAAVGTCKNCQRGICRECVVEVQDGIACTGACERQVAAMGKAWKHNALTMSILGIYTLALGLVMATDQVRSYVRYGYADTVAAGIAAVMLTAGTAFLWIAWRVRRRRLREDRP